MSNIQLSKYQALAFGEITEQDVITLRETIGKDCNDSQFKLFMSIAKSAGANPIVGEIHPSVFGGKLTVQFGIDFHIRNARESEGFLGYDVQLVQENDEFSMHQERSEDGRYYVVIDKHSWGMPRGKVIGGYCLAYKEGFKPFSVVMEVDEVEHYKRSQIGMQKTMWNNNFNDMFKKHMVKRALKAAFGLNFGEEDIEQRTGEKVSEYQPNKRVDITPQEEQFIVVDENKTIDPAEETKKLWAEINKKLEKYGKERSDLTKLIKEKVKKKPEEMSLPEIVGLSKMVDLEFTNQPIEAEFEDVDPSQVEIPFEV
jgi:recombination protein RecT